MRCSFADTITHQQTFKSLSVVRYERIFVSLSLEINYSKTYNAATFGCVVSATKVELVKIISSEALAEAVTLQWTNSCPGLYLQCSDRGCNGRAGGLGTEVPQRGPGAEPR